MVDRKPVVAIDGPSGAGKSTIATFLAKRFGLLNLESGAMYRAVALKALRLGLPLDDEPALSSMAETMVIDLSEVKKCQEAAEKAAPAAPGAPGSTGGAPAPEKKD